MTVHPDPALRSYLKTAWACLGVLSAGLLFGVIAVLSLPGLAGHGIAGLGWAIALVGGVLSGACWVVIVRHRRSVAGQPDLFLELNRSREPAAVMAAGGRRISRARRWFASRLFGHDLVVGDVVEVMSWAEIRLTLDERGCLEELPFMPEMKAMCGQRATVFRSMHRLFDYRKTRAMRHMDGAVLLVGIVCDGSSHGGCEAACHTVWKAAWLRKLQPGAKSQRELAQSIEEPMRSPTGIRPTSYTCQLTQLHAASRPITRRSLWRQLMPLVSGNVAPAAFAVGWLTHLFNELQELRGGVGFPDLFSPIRERNSTTEHAPAKGDLVVVRTPAEIRATLNERLMNKGLWFEPDMLKFCAGRYVVQGEIRRVIDIVTGEMLSMKTPAYILRDVHFSGERQLFNAQYEPLYWRSAWLSPVEYGAANEA